MTKNKNTAVKNGISKNALLVLSRMRNDVQATLRQYVSRAKPSASSCSQEDGIRLRAN